MMWKKTKWYLIVASAAMNVAFVAMWIAYAAPLSAHPETSGQRETHHQIWCPLHRELGVNEEQWAQIGPRLREFQAAVGELSQKVSAKRSEVIDLVAAEDPDAELIRAKQDEILATKRKIQDLVADHLVAEKEILTPRQQQRLFELLRNRANRGAGPHMARGPRGDLSPTPRIPVGDSR
jgi:Spy/CpxP family protein refolding chaperone